MNHPPERSCCKLKTVESKALTFCFTEIIVVSPKVINATRPGKFISVGTLGFSGLLNFKGSQDGVFLNAVS